MSRAHEINVISTAVYEADFKDECDDLAKIADQLARVSARMREKSDAFARSKMSERQDEVPTPVSLARS